MKRHIMIILVAKRKESADRVQKTLTGWGCLIKTRLGLHEGVLDKCTNSGLIILELVGDVKKHKELKRKLELLPGVNVKLVTVAL
ncbi:MAG TPA: hypothetical protein PKZ41_04655 [Candidatus Omnitrophota bacterium]|nr:hypothetical protein [Candidatus Omnitrophota bacterium]